MATIGIGKGSYIRPYRRARMEAFPEDSSQTFIVGDPVILGSDSNEGHYIKISGSDPSTDFKLLGIAASAANGVKGHMVDVWLFTQDSEFIAHVSGAAAADETVDGDQMGVAYGIVADSTNLIWRLDVSETTAAVGRVVKLVDAHGDTNGRVVFVPLASERVYT